MLSVLPALPPDLGGVYNTGHLSFGKIPSPSGTFMPLHHLSLQLHCTFVPNTPTENKGQLMISRVGVLLLPHARIVLVRVFDLGDPGALATK